MAGVASKGKHDAVALEELNLVEFPIAMLCNRPPSSLKTISFSDRLFDREANDWISREVLVTAGDAFGLPTHFDMDVLLALMVLTQSQNRFQDRTVRFSLYQIIELLAISKFGGVHDRLRLALDRWCGTTVKFQNAWRSGNRWCSETFHFLDNVKLTKSRDFEPDQEQVFKWNDVVVESVQKQNTKPFDWVFYRSLSSPIAKRMYRFLDKRFFHRRTWEFEVEEFAVNKLGLQAGQRSSKYNQKLREGILELEEAGFLATGKSTVEKQSKGVFQVSFVRSTAEKQLSALVPPTPIKREEWKDLNGKVDGGIRNESELDSPPVTELVRRGVNRFQAIELVSAKPDECGLQIQYFDFQIKQGWKPAKSGGGYLRTAILGAYAAPEGFKPREAVEQEEAARKKKTAEKQKTKQLEDAKLAADRQEFKRQEELVKAYRTKIGEDAWRSLVQELAGPQDGFRRQYFLSSEYEQVKVVFEARLKTS